MCKNIKKHLSTSSTKHVIFKKITCRLAYIKRVKKYKIHTVTIYKNVKNKTKYS